MFLFFIWFQFIRLSFHDCIGGCNGKKGIFIIPRTYVKELPIPRMDVCYNGLILRMDFLFGKKYFRYHGRLFKNKCPLQRIEFTSYNGCILMTHCSLYNGWMFITTDGCYVQRMVVTYNGWIFIKTNLFSIQRIYSKKRWIVVTTDRLYRQRMYFYVFST